MVNSKILGWMPRDVKSLFSFLQVNSGNSLINNITLWANKNLKQPFSVRNYFYKLLRGAKEDDSLNERLLGLGIRIENFSQDNKQNKTKQLLWAVLDYSQKQSVFSACNSLAKGNRKLALKYQNKYRNTLSNHPEIVEEVLQEMRQKGIPTRIVFAKNNVLKMPQSKEPAISSNDLYSLVVGIVNLIKSDTQKELVAQHQKRIQTVNNNLQKVLIDSRRKDVLLEELRQENKKIRTMLEKTQKQHDELKEKSNASFLTIQSLLQSNKHKSLHNFVSKLLQNTQTSAK